MLIAVLGGARSGKSRVAEAIAARLPPPVTYVATLIPDDRDADLAARIETHRRRRPSSWQTVEATADLMEQVRELSGTVLVDSLGPWVAMRDPDIEIVVALSEALRRRPGDSVVVSDEVGLAVHPTSTSALEFRDRLGDANQALAAVADTTLFVVAGHVLRASPLDVDAVLRGAD